MKIKRALGRIILEARALVTPPGRRASGPLAKEGGVPVRGVHLRPWASVADGNASRWRSEARGMLRKVYVRGAEGLPQRLANDFAERWAAYTGAKYALLVAHGTDALRIALAATFDHDGLEYGGEIIVPNYSFIASATAALDRRFGVAFVDVDPKTLLLDPRRVEEAIVPGKTRAILPVHLFGQPADMTALQDIARRHGLRIIEDAAQAHGAAWDSGPVGSLGDAAAFSFQSSKNLSCGEGGALVTNDEAIFNRAYAMHNVGRSRVAPNRWAHLTLGWNCRPTEYQAALLIHRLKFFDRQQERRRENFAILREEMSELACLEPLALHPGVRAHGMYMFAMRFRSEGCGGIDLDQFAECVRAEGVPMERAFNATLSDQPAIQRLIEKHPGYFRCLPTPVAHRATRETAYLPHEVFLGNARDMRDIAAAMTKVERHFSGAPA